ncbi:carbohydrate ABC transporter permease [Fusobacterium necrophorum]|uniref:ABC transporter permease n=2 Tax=Fusobacterium necrophorum TaxID=859 RepID=A0AB73BYZ0_9FUSO|nr:carbohydrate ABC transporter permease [Fusobacterium necrophorum]KDE63613.1 ABC transporter permease [Fusobacterium necrophorum BFTR-1]KDE65360.1 ABC transporter permease [Fusobacterium necrophorum BL]KDE65546.1 ABC transporter permease [Fusobacterium necrophorum DJ-1]KDE69584.1 ABC transporter permease [Fusobacterium necrophorum DAB]KDE70047.1 ABC transporter permease [Fusobacterium necrophorum DJ-2]
MKIGNLIKKIPRGLIFFLLCTYAIMIIYPLLWMLISGFKDNHGLFINTWALPEKYIWQNYLKAWRNGIGKYFFNSIYVTFFSVVLTLFISTCCAFALSRFEFKSRKLVLLFIVGGLMLSPQVSLISLYKMLQKLHIYNTHWALIIPYTAYKIPFTTFLIHSYMVSLPREIEDSAYIDGCSVWQVFSKIIFPMCRPIIATASLFTAMSCWNEFMFALVFIESDSLRTIPVGMMNLRSSLSTEWTVLLAGLTLSVLPMVILYLIFQRQFIRGITSGGVKG